VEAKERPSRFERQDQRLRERKKEKEETEEAKRLLKQAEIIRSEVAKSNKRRPISSRSKTIVKEKRKPQVALVTEDEETETLVDFGRSAKPPDYPKLRKMVLQKVKHVQMLKSLFARNVQQHFVASGTQIIENNLSVSDLHTNISLESKQLSTLLNTLVVSKIAPADPQNPRGVLDSLFSSWFQLNLILDRVKKLDEQVDIADHIESFCLPTQAQLLTCNWNTQLTKTSRECFKSRNSPSIKQVEELLIGPYSRNIMGIARREVYSNLFPKIATKDFLQEDLFQTYKVVYASQHPNLCGCTITKQYQ